MLKTKVIALSIKVTLIAFWNGSPNRRKTDAMVASTVPKPPGRRGIMPTNAGRVIAKSSMGIEGV